MVEKLSAADEGRIMRALEKAAALTRTGAGPDEALTKAAGEFGLNPEMTKVACQAFNKSKSVYMLSKMASSRRGEAFDLCDPDKVVTGLFQEKRAVAANKSLDNILQDFTSLGLMPKAASLRKEASAPAEPSEAERSLAYQRDMRDTLRALDKFDKLHGDMQMKKTAAELAVQDACKRMSYVSKPELEKVARTVVNRYGDDGIRFMRVAEAKLSATLDLRKTASAAAIPAREPYFSVTRAMDAMESYNKAVAHLEGVAKAAYAGMRKSSEDEAGLGAIKTLTKTPAGLAVGAAVAPFDLASSVVPSEISSWQQIAEGKGKAEETLGEALDPELIKQLENMDLQDAWVSLSKDKFVSSHPREKVLQAISDVVNIMPSMKVPRNKPLLLSMVRKHLAQGSSVDPVEIGQIAQTEKTLQQAEKERLTAEIAERASLMAGDIMPVPKGDFQPVEIKPPSGASLPQAAKTAGSTLLELADSRDKSKGDRK